MALAFRDVNGMFNNVASFINTSTAGGGDVFGQWMSDLSNYWNNNNGIQALWGLITGAFSGVLESLLLLVGYILFPITYALFSLFYTLYGSILYVVGPFVLALYPALGFGVMARKYLVNLMIFNAWGVLYSIFGALMAAINMNSVNAVLNSGNFTLALSTASQGRCFSVWPAYCCRSASRSFPTSLNESWKETLDRRSAW